MKLDQALTGKLARFRQASFKGSVFRATGGSFDPTAASLNGGRWAPRPNDEPGFPVLYTSLERDGALAEVASYLALLNPMPSKPVILHELSVTASKTITVAMGDLEELGVDPDRYSERNYERTQMIGATINYLGLDGLISPSARWKCSNLTLFMDHHALEETLEVVRSEEIDWQDWARRNGLLRPIKPGARE
ncbi:MAG: RES family NAD+ phosphorylase [Propylenella sp.]